MSSALIALTLTTCSDPGIVPRERHNTPYKTPTSASVGGSDNLENGTALGSSYNQVTPDRSSQTTPDGNFGSNERNQRTTNEVDDFSSPLSKAAKKRLTGQLGMSQDLITTVNGVELPISKCYTCNIPRPPRSFHCSDCKACIEVHDHHCPWVGTCVGKRNHRYFFLFTLLTTVHSVYTLVLDALF